MGERNVTLNETGLFLLYRAMVCQAIDLNPHIKDVIEVDPWEYSSALDMSFEETAKLPLEKWHIKIADDLDEMWQDLKNRVAH